MTLATGNAMPLARSQCKLSPRAVPARMASGVQLSRLLAPHPLQVCAGYNQLQPLFVTVTDWELLHARR
jgi:hypothetical protein